MRRIGWTISGIIGCALVLNCSSPTAPSPLALVAGPNWLVVTGGLSDAPCAQTGLPREGTSVTTLIVLEKGHDEWIGRSRDPQESVELRLQASANTIFGTDVTGTIQGAAVDTAVGTLIPARDLAVTLSGVSGGQAEVHGTIPIGSHGFAQGRIGGLITFRESAGPSSQCSAISWSVRPAVGVN